MPDPVWLVTHPDGLVVRERDPLLADRDLRALGLDAGAGHHVVDTAARTVWVHSLTAPELPEGFASIGLRKLYGAVSDEVFGAAVRAVQVATFVETHRYCGRCATPTVGVEGERALRCPGCALVSYPRLAPAIIVLVRRGEQALLARNARFPAAFYSTLAGFVEIGETLEDALRREVKEEVGIEVGSLRYFGSQPWPFPHQLMVGFTAEWTAGELRVDGEEIADAQWFDRHALPAVPPKLSIARQLIEAWLEETARPSTID